MKKLYIYIALVTTAIFAACSDNDTTTPATGLSVSINGVEVSSLEYNIGTSFKMLSINTDADWTVSIPEEAEEWLTITPHAGYGWEYADTAETNLRAYVKATVTANSGSARSTTLTVKAGGLTLALPVTQKGYDVDPDDPFESAVSMIAKLNYGYNLGNTLDANPDYYNSSWLDFSGGTSVWETSWGQPVTTQEIINDIVDAGFNIIRVPTTWYPHLDEDDNIDAEWMARVKEVVDYVINAGAYCILNVQHDTGEKSSGRLDDAAWLYADLDAYPTQTIRYQKIWQQIAEEFIDYPQELIFESFNEILNASYSWTAPSAGNGAYTAINKLQQDFVNTVRATGGNNQYRNLAITTYSAKGNPTVPLNELTVPEDVTDYHIYGSIHSYDPYNFCNDNSGDGYDYNITTFDSDCQATIDEVVVNCYNRFTELGIPFIFGEFGAIDENKEMAERVKYATYMATKMKAYNTTGLWWMGLYTRSPRTWCGPLMVAAL